MQPSPDISQIYRELDSILTNGILQLPRTYRSIVSSDLAENPFHKIQIDNKGLQIAVYDRSIKHKIEFYERKYKDILPSVFAFINKPLPSDQQGSNAKNGGLKIQGRRFSIFSESPISYVDLGLHRTKGPLFYIHENSSLLMRNINIPVLEGESVHNIRMPLCVSMCFGNELSIYNCSSELDLIIRKAVFDFEEMSSASRSAR